MTNNSTTKERRMNIPVFNWFTCHLERFIKSYAFKTESGQIVGTKKFSPKTIRKSLLNANSKFFLKSLSHPTTHQTEQNKFIDKNTLVNDVTSSNLNYFSIERFRERDRKSLSDIFFDTTFSSNFTKTKEFLPLIYKHIMLMKTKRRLNG